MADYQRQLAAIALPLGACDLAASTPSEIIPSGGQSWLPPHGSGADRRPAPVDGHVPADGAAAAPARGWSWPASDQLGDDDRA